MKYFYWFIQTLMWPLMWLGIGFFYRIKISGKEHLRGLSSPLLIIANHRSVLDSFLIGMALPWGSRLFPVRPMSEDLQFTGKYLEFLRKLRLLKIFFALAGSFPSRRGQGILRATEIPIQILKEGGTVVMFPEGRIHYGMEELGEFYHGASTIALGAGTSVLPFYIKKLKWHIRIAVGEPFSLSTTTPEEGTEIFRQKLLTLSVQQ